MALSEFQSQAGAARTILGRALRCSRYPETASNPGVRLSCDIRIRSLQRTVDEGYCSGAQWTKLYLKCTPYRVLRAIWSTRNLPCNGVQALTVYSAT